MESAVFLGSCAGGVYAVLAAIVIALDRRSSGGGWIRLAGIGSFLVTLPVSYLAERLGHRLDHRSNVHMAGAVLGTGSCVALVAGLVVLPFTT